MYIYTYKDVVGSSTCCVLYMHAVVYVPSKHTYVTYASMYSHTYVHVHT